MIYAPSTLGHLQMDWATLMELDINERTALSKELSALRKREIKALKPKGKR
jgi:hypothetical protein